MKKQFSELNYHRNETSNLERVKSVNGKNEGSTQKTTNKSGSSR